MKKILFVAILVLSFLFSFSQEELKKEGIKFTGVELCSGKGAVTSGFYTFLNFSSEKAFSQVTLSANDLELTHLFRFEDDKFLIGFNGGYFFNAPYGGVQLVFTPFKFFQTFHWVGWSLCPPNEVLTFNDPGFLFLVNCFSVNVWRFKGAYSVINYMKNLPQQTFTVKYDQKINDQFTVYTDIGWDFLNKNQLLKVGVNYNL
ncbi:hypothetical protein EOL94_01195 [bacterium]|nr:hypothetical protein [bacterium]